MRDFTQDLRDVRRRLDEAESYLSIIDNRERFAVLEAEIADPALWDDQDRARRLNAEYANIKDDLAIFDGLTDQIGDLEVLHRDAGCIQPGLHRPFEHASRPARVAAGHDDKSGQILRIAAQPVGEPGTQTWLASHF